MSVLNAKQIAILLDALKCKYGPGYSDDPEVGRLQATLSIMAEVAMQRERGRDGQEVAR